MRPPVAASPGHDAARASLTIPIFVLAAACFAVIAWQVGAVDRMTLVDCEVSAWLHRHATPALTSLMIVVTTLNSTWAVAVYAALIATYEAWRGRAGNAVEWVAGVGGILLVNDVLKHLFERARPQFDDPLLHLETYSFPSGHAAASTAFYGLLLWWVVRRTGRWPLRLAAAFAAAATIALVAFSRVYLGVHYLSDVLAGFFAGAAWLALTLRAMSVRNRTLPGVTMASKSPAPPDR